VFEMLTRSPSHRKTIFIWAIVGALLALTYIASAYAVESPSLPSGAGLLFLALVWPASVFSTSHGQDLHWLAESILLLAANVVFYASIGWVGWIVLQKIKAAARMVGRKIAGRADS